MRNILLTLLLLALVACGSPATSSTATNPTGSTETSPASTDSTATSAPSSSSTTGEVPQPGSVAALVAQQIGTQLQIQGSQLRVLSTEEKVWPDSALGCPTKGMMYSQIVTPGFLLHYTDGTKQYEAHTDKSGSRVVVCQGGQPLITK